MSVKRLHGDVYHLPTNLSRQRWLNLVDWKVSVQKCVERITARYVQLPPNRHTGLQLLTIIGDEWKHIYPLLGLSKLDSLEILQKVINQLLKSLCHVVWNSQDGQYTDTSITKGHLVMTKEGKQQLHVYVVDETVPKLEKVYAWYLEKRERVEQGPDEVVVHFIMEDKKLRFFMPNCQENPAYVHEKH